MLELNDVLREFLFDCEVKTFSKGQFKAIYAGVNTKKYKIFIFILNYGNIKSKSYTVT
ncbi:MAG: hypothetical protein ACREV6_20340 [Clostridium sp.]|uniref:hypothetical protein n=1 Tax=Clostridium sp. TaxID=1506 RepID=UPI003D6D5444